MATTTMPAPEAQAPINHFGRIIGVFVSPSKTFAGIAERPSWLAPLLLMVILGTGVGALMNAKMNWGEYIRHKAEENTRFSQLSEEQKDQAVAGQIVLVQLLLRRRCGGCADLDLVLCLDLLGSVQSF